MHYVARITVACPPRATTPGRLTATPAVRLLLASLAAEHGPLVLRHRHRAATTAAVSWHPLAQFEAHDGLLVWGHVGSIPYYLARTDLRPARGRRIALSVVLGPDTADAPVADAAWRPYCEFRLLARYEPLDAPRPALTTQAGRDPASPRRAARALIP